MPPLGDFTLSLSHIVKPANRTALTQIFLNIFIFKHVFIFELKLRQSVFVNKGPIDFTIMKEPLRRPWESSRLYATYASVCF